MTISFQPYQESEFNILVDVISRFWDDLIAKDQYQRMVHPPEYGEVYSQELLKKLKAGEGLLVWAVEHGQKIGFAAGVVEEQSITSRVEVGVSKMGRILEVFVEPAHRNKQAGAALIQHMEEYLAGRGCDTLKIEVFALNTGAHRLYKRLGYSDWVVDLFKRVSPTA